MPNFDDFKLSIEALSGGKNTVLFDDMEMPSVMVPFPKLKISELITGGSENIHPAFRVDGNEKNTMYVSKFQNIVLNDRAYSLPMREPRTSVNFDQAVTYCRNKGQGWSVTPFSLWAALALWTRKNATMPRGNNNYGRDHAYTHEKGVIASVGSDGRTNRTLTGSGPASWNHNWMPDGIADLNGNVWEWCAGMRLVNGEIQIIPDANCMMADASLAASSTLWKAILADGSLVAPGTTGTLKYSDAFALGTTAGTSTGISKGFNAIVAGDGITIPEIAKALILAPAEPNGDYGGDARYVNLTDERVPICGGNWANGGNAGVFYVDLGNPRSNSYDGIGFRSAYCAL